MLKVLRAEIDEIDEKLICLLSKRLHIAERIGEYKKEKGLPALDEKRWEKVLKNRVKLGKKHDLSENFVKEVWEIIHHNSLMKQ